MNCWMRNAYDILIGSQKGRDHSKDLGINGRIILYIDWIHLTQWTSGGLL